MLSLAELVDLGDLRLAALAALRGARVGAGVVCRALVVDDVADLRRPLLLGRCLLDQGGVDPAVDAGAAAGDRDQVDRVLPGRVERRDLRLAGLAARAGGGVRARVVDPAGVVDDVADLQIAGRLRGRGIRRRSDDRCAAALVELRTTEAEGVAVVHLPVDPLDHVRGVALDRDDRGAVHALDDAGVADVRGGLPEEDLIARLRVLGEVAALLLVVVQRPPAAGAVGSGLALDLLGLLRVAAGELVKAPVDEDVAPGVAVFIAVVVAGGVEVAGELGPVVRAGVRRLVVKLGVARLLFVAELGRSDFEQPGGRAGSGRCRLLRGGACELVEVFLAVAGAGLLYSLALVSGALVLQQDDVGRLPDGGRRLQDLDDGRVAADLLPEEAELRLQVSDRGPGALCVFQERLLARPVGPLCEAVAGGVVDEVGVLAGVHGRGVFDVVHAELLLVAVLQVGRDQGALCVEVPHEAGRAVGGQAFAGQIVPYLLGVGCSFKAHFFGSPFLAFRQHDERRLHPVSATCDPAGVLWCS